MRCKDDVRFVKPNPEGFRLIKEFAGNEQLFVMIGDSNADEEVARQAGVDFIRCETFR